MPIQNFQILQTLSRKFGDFHCPNTIINPGPKGNSSQFWSNQTEIHIQILQTDLHTFLLRIVERIWFMIKVFSFNLVIYLLFTLIDLLMLLGENWCWQLLGPKGLSLHYSTVKKKLKTPSVVVTNTEDKEMYPVFRRHNLRELAYCISLVYQYVFPRLSGWIPLGWPKSGSIIWDHLDKPINLFPKAKEFIGYYDPSEKWTKEHILCPFSSWL